MFGRLFGRGAERPEGDPHILPVPRRQKNGMYTLRALGDTWVLALIEAADAGDWAAVKTALAPFDLGRDHRVLGELAELGGVQDWIVRAVEEDKEHRATALLISGARHIAWGWEARTAERAVNVTQEQWRVFHERLETAEEHLLEAAELRPDWVTPWRQLLTSGRGMSLGAGINEARRDAALRRDPLDPETHLEWLSQLQPRWGGEPGQALAFAQGAFARAPHGHRLGCLIAMAYIEEWVESDRGDYLVTEEIQAQLREAADHSILHPAYVWRPGWQQDFNMFAMALSLSGERHTVRRVFQTLDGAYTEWPWGYFSEPEKQFARRHRRA
ncbi:hypothetical protein UK15_06440 [Streptomyces variegatus]|uniref:DUF4034 domain-containing protein n=1 Tax=Streptomyces variegatus TaxID=284040 RepID=A0A0M2GYE9_9ACTN|nr:MULTISPECIES: hypothetical protein [Streptomyces]KJK40679.1 hypothetical protein UK15_06440 [Streptomyces variegatus]